MPAILPFTGEIPRHAISQGYVQYVEQPIQFITLDGTFRVIPDMTINASIDATADVLQIFRCNGTVFGFKPSASDVLEFRLRRGSNVSPIIQNIGLDPSNDVWNGAVMMFWGWTGVSEGIHTFSVEARMPGGTAPVSILTRLHHVVVALKK